MGRTKISPRHKMIHDTHGISVYEAYGYVIAQTHNQISALLKRMAKYLARDDTDDPEFQELYDELKKANKGVLDRRGQYRRSEPKQGVPMDEQMVVARYLYHHHDLMMLALRATSETDEIYRNLEMEEDEDDDE